MNYWYSVNVTIGQTSDTLLVQAPSYAEALGFAEAAAKRRTWFPWKKSILATTAKRLGPAAEPAKDKFWEELAR